MMTSEDLFNIKKELNEKIKYEKANIRNLENHVEILSKIIIYDIAIKNDAYKTVILKEGIFEQIEKELFYEQLRNGEKDNKKTKDKILMSISKDIGNEKNFEKFENIMEESFVNITCSKFQLKFSKKKENAKKIKDLDTLKKMESLMDFDLYKKLSRQTEEYLYQIKNFIKGYEYAKQVKNSEKKNDRIF